MGDGGGRASRQWHERIAGRDVLGSFEVASDPCDQPRPDADKTSLAAALLDPDAGRADAMLRRIARRDPDRFTARLVVETARELGEMWLRDEASFVEVSIATARLQSALRGIDPGPEAFDGPLVAMVVPEGETHTLGAAVAAWRLRRAGASVMLLVDRPEPEVLARVGGGEMAAVCLSVGRAADGAPPTRLVERLRAASGAPVLLGGAILEWWEPGALRAATGADHVGGTPEDALRVAQGAGA